MLQKRMRKSLTAKIFIITTLILLAGGIVTFALLAIVTPESLNRCMITWVSGIAPGLVGKIGETGTEGKK